MNEYRRIFFIFAAEAQVGIFPLALFMMEYQNRSGFFDILTAILEFNLFFCFFI